MEDSTESVPRAITVTPSVSNHDPHVQAVATSVREPAGLAMAELVGKRWGQEIIYINGSYCMKRIEIKEGHATSMHFHVHKHETLLVTEGVLTLRYKDGRGNDRLLDIKPGEAFVVPPGFQHKLCADTSDVVLIEASTYDDKEDSIRVHM